MDEREKQYKSDLVKIVRDLKPGITRLSELLQATESILEKDDIDWRAQAEWFVTEFHKWAPTARRFNAGMLELNARISNGQFLFLPPDGKTDDVDPA